MALLYPHYTKNLSHGCLIRVFFSLSPNTILEDISDISDVTKNMGIHWEYDGDLSGFLGDRMGTLFFLWNMGMSQNHPLAEAYNRNRDHLQTLFLLKKVGFLVFLTSCST